MIEIRFNFLIIQEKGLKFEIISLLLYLAMGWLIVLDINSLFDLISSDAKLLLISGGISYTFGIIFYVMDKICVVLLLLAGAIRPPDIVQPAFQFRVIAFRILGRYVKPFIDVRGVWVRKKPGIDRLFGLHHCPSALLPNSRKRCGPPSHLWLCRAEISLREPTFGSMQFR